jgi:hypothetical protein
MKETALMTQLDKAQQRFDLTVKLGMILGDVERMVKVPKAPPAFDYYHLAEILRADLNVWSPAVDEFARTESGGVLGFAYQLKKPLEELRREVLHLAKTDRACDAGRQTTLAAMLDRCRKELGKQMALVPLHWTPTMYAAQSQLTIYCRMRESLSSATQRVQYFDRYLHRDFFHLYLRDLPRHLEIKLCTTAGRPREDYGVCSVRLISKRAAAEFTNYELRRSTPAELHDRNLRVDAQIFHLGPSVEDAGRSPMNWTLGDSTPAGHKLLDDILSNATLITY